MRINLMNSYASNALNNNPKKGFKIKVSKSAMVVLAPVLAISCLSLYKAGKNIGEMSQHNYEQKIESAETVSSEKSLSDASSAFDKELQLAEQAKQAKKAKQIEQAKQAKKEISDLLDSIPNDVKESAYDSLHQLTVDKVIEAGEIIGKAKQKNQNFNTWKNYISSLISDKGYTTLFDDHIKNISPFDDLIKKHASGYATRTLLWAIIAQESGGKIAANSPKEAKGLMQFMPKTAIEYELKDRLDPEQSLIAGVKLLNKLREKQGDNIDRILAEYNCGPGSLRQAINKSGKVDPKLDEYKRYLPEETQKYIDGVVAKLIVYSQRLDDEDALAMFQAPYQKPVAVAAKEQSDNSTPDSKKKKKPEKIYVVEAGDGFTTIPLEINLFRTCSKVGLDLDTCKRYNPKITDFTNLNKGTRIRVPVRAVASSDRYNR